MMTTKTLMMQFLLVFLLFTYPVKTENDFVRVKFEIDGKPFDQGFKILIYVNHQVLEPLRFENGFVVPPEVKNYEKVDVRFLFGKNDLLYESVSVSKFTTDWVVGVERKFSHQDEDLVKNGKRLKIRYYIKFLPDDAEGTVMTVKIYENHPEHENKKN